MSSSDSGVFRKFDDTDPGILYSPGDWFDNPGIEGVFNHTLSSTTKQGATVHIEFTASQIVIIGASIAPAGASDDSGPISAYVLDGAKNTAFLFQANATNATDVTFFNSGALKTGNHTLDIDVISITDNIPYLLDAVYLQQSVDSGQSSTSTAVWVSTVFQTPTSAPTNIADKNNVSEKDRFAPSEVAASQIEPFLAPARTTTYSDNPPYSPRAPSEVPHTPQTPHTYPPPASSVSGSGAGSSSGRTLSVVNDSSDVGYLTPAQRKAAEAKRESERVQFHADSGVRFDSEGRPVVASSSEVLPLADVPPEYTPS
ncbi:hypothetical protein FKP32DRAFT_1674388 [Trametes sanguinea]|nr:hypothetical protein FKP32DRAFT_1674388 [Trametes sanguinea]